MIGERGRVSQNVRKRSVSTQDSILLIDDNQLVARPLREYFVRCGRQVDATGEACAATRLMHSRRYVVVLLDPYLTGAVRDDGESPLAAVRGLQPGDRPDRADRVFAPALAAVARRQRAAVLLPKAQSVPFLSQFVVSASRGAASEIPIHRRTE